MPNKFITALTDGEYNKLIENFQTSDNFRLRNRSHAILLSFQRHSIDEIAKICQVHRETVAIWIIKWMVGKGLEDGARSGRRPILTVAEQEQAFATAMQNPKFPSRQLGEIKRQTGKEITKWTLKRLVKKKDYLWKRIKLGLWKKTDEDEKEFAKQDLAKLTAKADKGLIDLIYGDQSGFNLAAKVVYAWQKRGERIVIPVSKGKSQNVLGFMWHRCQRFESFVFTGSVDSHVMIGCLDLIARSLNKETWLVLDNAPIHRSEEFEEKMKEWAKLGLRIYFLPTYCPSLNKIEILWQKIKYDWLSWDAYSSYKNLCQELDQILSQIGSLYRITFA